MISEGENRCKLPFRIISGSVPDDFFLEQNIPNPVIGSGTIIIFGMPEAGLAEIIVTDLAGREVLKTEPHNYTGGIWEIELNTNILPSSVYIYILKTGKVKIARLFVVSK